MKPKLLTQGLAFIAMCMMAIVPMKAEERKAALVVWNGESELYSFFISDRPVLKVHNGNAIIQSDGVWEEYVNLQPVSAITASPCRNLPNIKSRWSSVTISAHLAAKTRPDYRKSLPLRSNPHSRSMTARCKWPD